MEIWTKWIIELAVYSVAITLIALICRFRRIPPTFLGPAVAYILVTNLTQFFSSLLSERKMNNLWILHIYTVLEFVVITWFFTVALKGFVRQHILLLVMAGFTVLSVLNSIYLQNLNEFNTYARGLESILVMSMSIGWFVKTLHEMKITNLWTAPLFWINSGFLLYFSGSFMVFSVSNLLMENFNRSLNLYLWTLHAVLNIMLNLSIFKGIWMLPKR